jgi:hypothetical protein
MKCEHLQLMEDHWFYLATDFGGKWERVASRISGALSVPVGMVDDKSTFFFICNDLSSSESKSKF